MDSALANFEVTFLSIGLLTIFTFQSWILIFIMNISYVFFQNLFGEKKFSALIALFISDIIMMTFDMNFEAFIFSIFFSTVFAFVISFAFMNSPNVSINITEIVEYRKLLLQFIFQFSLK